MKKRYLALAFGLMVAVTAVKSNAIYAEDASASGVTQQQAVETEQFGEVTEAENGEIVLAVGTIQYENGMTLKKDGQEIRFAVTERTVIKSAGGTEGETASADEIQAGSIVAVSLTAQGDEALALTILPAASVEEETESLAEAETENGVGGQSGSGTDGQQPAELPDGQTAGENNGQGGPGGDGQQPPELPEGQTAGENNGQGGPGGNGQQPPELPDGQNGEGMNGQGGPGGNGQGGPGGNGQGGPGMGGAPGGQSQGVESYDAVNEYAEDAQIAGETIASTGTDENAILVDAADATVTVSDSTVTRESSDSTGGDNASFYGVGAALLATDGTLIVENSEITTDASGAAGVFAYGDGIAYVSDTTIETAQNTSGGIHAAGGGTLYAWNLDVTTNGGSAAAIRSDRGGGTMVVDGGSYISNGSGSPAIYCTADITVNNAKLEATGSEAICIEGLNTIRLFDCDLTGDMPDQDQNDISWNVIVYQSMSGDSVEGNGTFEMNGGSLTAKNGGMFYTTNTESTITLNNVDITCANENPFFLQVTGNSNARGWGSTGSNGADCLFTAISQEMEGDVIWDSISQLDFYMTNSSILTGAFVQDETWAGEGGDGYCSVVIDAASTWIVTGDSTVTTLSCAGTIVDEDGEAVSVVGIDGTVYVEGSSDYTITTGSYSETADTTGAGVTSSWEDYEVERA